MSHFTVAVITKGKPTMEVIEKALAPYDENKEVVTWTTKQELIAKQRKEIEDYKNSTYAEYIKDKEAYKVGCRNDNHIKYLEEEFPKKLEWTDEECYQSAIKYEDEENIAPDGSLRSTYNPNSKWDWYQVGGRWAGRLFVPITCENYAIGEKSWGWGNKNPYECEFLQYKRVDSARIKDLVFPSYQKEYAKAKRFWELYIENQKPITEADKELIKWVFYRKEYYLDTYKDKETYAECEATFFTYAVIDKDGNWHEKGEMGWWGISTNEDDAVAYIKGYKEKVFDNAGEDDYITIVDCHI